VLRRDRDAEQDPDSKVKQREEGRAFQREGPMVAKDLVWAIAVLTRRTKRTCQSEERRGQRYFGATPSLKNQNKKFELETS